MPERPHDLLERLAEADSFARSRGNFAESPKDRMDALSQILSGVKLNGAVFFTAEFPAPWGVVLFPYGDPHPIRAAVIGQPAFPNYGITAKIKSHLSPLHAGGGGAFPGSCVGTSLPTPSSAARY